MNCRRSPNRISVAAWLSSLALLVLPLTGCSRADTPTVFDFIDQFKTADQIVERQTIDFGRPAVRSVMREGWLDKDERWSGKTTFVWGLGRYSSFDLSLIRARPVTLTLRGRPFRSDVPQPEAPPPTAVRVVVNGWPAVTLQLRDGFQTYEVEVPAEAVSVGSNRVELRYLHDAAEVKGGNSRSRRVAWASAAIGQALSLDVPGVNDDADSLILPFHTGLDFFAEVPSGTSLAMSGLETWGDAPSGSFLEVDIAFDGSDVQESVELMPSSWRTPPAVPVAEGETAIVRVSLRARPGTEKPSGGRPEGREACPHSRHRR